MARVRAEESSRDDRLFDDPYAEAFVNAAAGALPAGRVSSSDGMMAGVVHGAVIRTRYYDDFLLEACDRGCRQVVLVGAGLDSRAFRLPWPAGLRWWEIDLPEVLAFKEQVLVAVAAVPRCERVTVGADVRGPWPRLLLDAGFRRWEQTAWLVEGLLIYLAADEAARLLTGVATLCGPGSRLACEESAARGDEHPRQPVTPRLAPFAAMWKGGLGVPTSRWLAERGWQVQVTSRSSISARLGRPAPLPSGDGYLTAIWPAG
jgi:methyltransferase (TIGR00027 family)